MRVAVAVALAALLVGSVAAHGSPAPSATIGDDVLKLTKDNFKKTISDNEYVLVEFFAPWCGHCKTLAPEYAKAATVLKAHGVVLAAVDATEEQALATSHGVKSYPTLKWFHNGEASEYTGGRTESKIIKWALKASGAPLMVVEDAPTLNVTITLNKVLVAGFVAPGSEELAALQQANANEPDLPIVAVHSEELAKLHGVEIPSVVIFRYFDTPAVLSAPFTAQSITEFVGAEKVPYVIPFTMEAAGDIFQSSIKQVAFLFSKTPVPEFEDIAKQFRGKFVFASSDGSVSRLNDHVGVSSDNFPHFIILSLAQPMLRYPLDGEATPETITAHLEQFEAGELQPVFKSEPVPAANDDPVKVVVGTTFEEIVLDPTKNVLLEIYAPWCGHCKQLAPVYEQLATELEDRSDIVIAKLDGTLNEIRELSWRSFPTLKFYPAGNKTPAGQDYEGGRDLESLKSFVLKNSVKGGAAGESHEEL